RYVMSFVLFSPCFGVVFGTSPGRATRTRWAQVAAASRGGARVARTATLRVACRALRMPRRGVGNGWTAPGRSRCDHLAQRARVHRSVVRAVVGGIDRRAHQRQAAPT